MKGIVYTGTANNALQQTKTALASVSIRLSHTGLLLGQGSLPVVRARFRLLKASVRHFPAIAKGYSKVE